MGSMPTCKVTLTWTKDEYLKVLRYHHQAELRPSLALVVDGGIALLGALGALMLFAPSASAKGSNATSYGIIFFALYWLLARRPLNKWWLTRNFLKDPTANTVVEWEFSQEQATVKSVGGSAVTEWKMFSKVREAKDGFLLYGYPESLFYWLPFAGFESPESIEQFRSIVRSKELPYTKRPA